LYNINNFSDNQIINIVQASISNGQIYRAHQYSNYVGEMLREIIKGRENQIAPDDLEKFNSLFFVNSITSETPF